MNGYSKSLPSASARGYTLVELLVVVVIIGILATQVLIQLSSPLSKVKGDILMLRSDINLARAEAVNRNKNVLTAFQLNVDLDGDGDLDDGYWICVDEDGDDDCDGADTTVKKVAFRDDVRLYAVNAVDSQGRSGPDVAARDRDGNGALDDVLDMEDGDDDDDGVSFVGNTFEMEPDGTTAGDEEGEIYLYVPDSGNPALMKAPPFSAVVSVTGMVRVLRWRSESGAWSGK